MSRRHGVVDSAGGLIPFGHLGWGYRDRSEFLTRAAEYIADGLIQNQWVEYVGVGSRDQLRAELDSIAGLADTSDIKVTPAPEFYNVADGGDVVDPGAAVAARVAAVENAIALGYSGFRAVVDVTAMAARPEQRDAFAQFEFLIDQAMATLPVSALCAYDIGRLADEAAGLLCLHPLVGPSAPTFRIYTESDADFALDGEIDAASATTFSTALQRIWPVAGSGELVIDARGLGFISHRELAGLDRLARRDDRAVLLRGCAPVLTRLAELLGLTNIRMEPAHEESVHTS